MESEVSQELSRWQEGAAHANKNLQISKVADTICVFNTSRLFDELTIYLRKISNKNSRIGR